MIIPDDWTVVALDEMATSEGGLQMRVNTARGNRGHLMVALASVVVAVLVGPLAGTASAAPQNQRGNHAMGITIKTYEGGQPGAVSAPTAEVASVSGIDVSSYQGNVNWQAQYNAGKRFAYVKATESTTYRNPYFAQQYNGSYNVGMIRGAYHFARPDRSSGATQASFFARNGGGWSADGKSLPGALDLEYNPYGATCYGKSKTSMTTWIRDFNNKYLQMTSRYPVIYSSTSWWELCVGSGHGFGATSPLWVAHYASAVGTLPSGWNYYTFWQYSALPIDQNRFNGAYDRLVALARG